MQELIIGALLMVSIDATDSGVMGQNIILGVYDSVEECMEAKGWIDEHQTSTISGLEQTLPRWLWCLPIEGEEA